MLHCVVGWVSGVQRCVWHPCTKPPCDVGSQVGLGRQESAPKYCRQRSGACASLCPDIYHFSLKWAELEALKFMPEKGCEL